MSTNTMANPPTAGIESKSARKKKAKAEAATASSSQADVSIARKDSPSVEKMNGHHDAASSETSDELPAIKEIQKNLRNTNKKLSAMSKLDSIIAENPDLSLDDLVTTRKINADQRAQALKKPALQAQVAQLEEQLLMLKDVEAFYSKKMELQRAKYEAELAKARVAHEAEMTSEQDRLRAPPEKQDVSDALKSFKPRFLTLTRFLRAAAARRQKDVDEQDEQTQAYEGVLLALYGGDSNAVFAAEKLINGSDDLVTSPDGTLLNLSFTQVRQLALKETPFLGAALYEPSDPDYEMYQRIEREDIANFGGTPAPEQEEAADNNAASGEVAASDPTVAHAGLTEIDSAEPPQAAAPSPDAADPLTMPASARIDEAAANAAGASRWDTKPAGSDDAMEQSYEIIPRPDSQVESPAQAAPANNTTTSWADDTPDAAGQAAAQTNGNAGFQEVHHRNQRGRAGYPAGYPASPGAAAANAGYQWQNVPQAPAHLRRGAGGQPGGPSMRGNGNGGGGGYGGRGRGDGGRGPRAGRGGPRGGARGRGSGPVR